LGGIYQCTIQRVAGTDERAETIILVLAGLSAFVKRFNPQRALVVGTDGIPIDEFYNIKIEDLF